MASLIALRKATAAPAGFFRRLTAGRSSACSRSFNTGTPGYAGDENDTVQVDNAPSRRNDDDSNRQGLSSSSDRGLDPRRDSAPAGFFLRDMVDPFSPTRTITQMLDLLNHLTDPFFATAATPGGGRQVREDEKNIYLTMEMPGLGKEDVKVYVESDDTLVIRGEVEESSSTEVEGRNYEGRKYYTKLNVPASGYRVDEITGEMKNGVLKVVIPKVTGDEKNRNDVKEVKVE
ncbi:unnamed protein product [Linum trigynum]|uniref:SHSP domain-containing protein n=1 Tax=Linum trigynum TaxID=586398 RepID=A0AAV2DQK8_9ROSI